MNVMRKLRGTGSAPAGNGSAGSNNIPGTHNANGGSSLPTGGSEDAMMDARVQISLQTLKKLFNEYTHPKEPLSEQERDMKLYQMLPLFCKVCKTERKCALQVDCKRKTLFLIVLCFLFYRFSVLVLLLI